MKKKPEWWELLAEAIIVQAVQDYRTLGKGPVQGDPTGALVNDAELKEFFYSDWFRHLTNVDGPYIYRRLKKERKNESIPRKCYTIPYRYHR